MFKYLLEVFEEEMTKEDFTDCISKLYKSAYPRFKEILNLFRAFSSSHSFSDIEED